MEEEYGSSRKNDKKKSCGLCKSEKNEMSNRNQESISRLNMESKKKNHHHPSDNRVLPQQVVKKVNGYVYDDDTNDDIESAPPIPCVSNRRRGYKEVTDIQIRAFVNPLTHVMSGCGRSDGSFYIRARRNKDVITVMWERIEGRLGANGITELKVAASFANLPPGVVYTPIWIQYNGRNRVGAFIVDPTSPCPFKFLIYPYEIEGEEPKANDYIVIHSGVSTWIESDQLPCIRSD